MRHDRSTLAHRRALARRLPDGLIVLLSAPEVLRNGDVHFAYRQDSSFLWLSGVEAPGHALLLDPARGEETLFVPRLTQQHALWLGQLPDLAEARRRFGVRNVAYADTFVATLAKRGGGRRVVYANHRAATLVRRAIPRARIDQAGLDDALAELRIVKDQAEIATLLAANVATANGYAAAMRVARAGLIEYQVQAAMEQEFRLAGCAHTGYGSIVASGPNAAVLHYEANTRRLGRGELLLVDAGAELHGYTADITRTFPVSGRFSARQRDLYEIVLSAQERCIDASRVGKTSLDLQRLAEAALAEGLRDLGLLRGSVEELVETEAVKLFFPHGIGHPLGLDVHDVRGGRRRQIRSSRRVKVRFRTALEPGFVITIEPGVYFIAPLLHDKALRRRHRGRVDFGRAEQWLGTGGVRIEDNVVVSKQGPPHNLTRVPKTIAAVEEACAS
jgi:Xaa-Pro aminopeptidase